MGLRGQARSRSEPAKAGATGFPPFRVDSAVKNRIRTLCFRGLGFRVLELYGFCFKNSHPHPEARGSAGAMSMRVGAVHVCVMLLLLSCVVYVLLSFYVFGVGAVRLCASVRMQRCVGVAA